jgi:hypothetical protein
MAVTVTPTPASGAITAKVTVVKFDLAGMDLNDSADYTTGAYPTWPEIRYYITFTLDSVELGRSPEFAPNHDGEWQFNNYIFPEAGAWTVGVYKVSDDSEVKTQAVTVA